MTDNKTRSTPVTSDQDQTDPATVVNPRRRFLMTGLGASAFVTTLHSRSAFAQTACSPSAALSGNLSGRHDTCVTFTRAFWLDPANDAHWPTEPDASSGFDTIFGRGYFTGNPGYSLRQVLAGSPLVKPLRAGQEPSMLSSEIVLAYLNASFFSQDGVHFVWNGGMLPAQIVSTVQATVLSNPRGDYLALYNTLQGMNTTDAVSESPTV
ncbi:MAG: hypothetical protein ACPGO3_14810 [Magnetospiraceae bacterium]